MGRYISQINAFFEYLPGWLRKRKIIVIALCTALTLLLAAGIGWLKIDDSLDAYFRNDDPVKIVYDQFKTQFGSDEYLYIVYKAKDGDIFSDQSLPALKGVHDELVNYRLHLTGGETSPLDHIEEVKSLINVKFMEAKDESLYSRNFIGDRFPESDKAREALREKALNHPDYPYMYLSQDSAFGGIMIRTDFNAEKMQGIPPKMDGSDSATSSFDDEQDMILIMEDAVTSAQSPSENPIRVKKVKLVR